MEVKDLMEVMEKVMEVMEEVMGGLNIYDDL